MISVSPPWVYFDFQLQEHVGMFGLVQAATFRFLDMINRNSHQAFSFLWLAKEGDGRNCELRCWQVRAKVKETQLRFSVLEVCQRSLAWFLQDSPAH